MASRKRVEATVLKRARDGSAFTRCEACNKDVAVVLIDLHSCSLDSKIRSSLEAQVVEKAVEVAAKTEKKRKSPSAGAGKGKKSKTGGDGAKKKRPQAAFFLFMKDFRLEFKASHPDEKGVAAVGKSAGEKWRSMTEEEKQPYVDQAKELKAKFDNGEGIVENNAGDEENADGDAEEVEEEEAEQEVDKTEKEEEDGEEEEKNELDDDI